MPLPSSIPTSFVPHPGGQQARQYRSNVGGVLNILAYVVLGIAVISAIGVFAYGKVLAGEKAAKDAELAKAEANIDPTAVQNFIRLRDRLSASSGLLDHHIAVSQFFTLLEKILPSTTRFTTLHIVTDAKGAVALQGSGVAQSFNALAAASNAFAKDGRIKDAIFSNIAVANSGAVSFKLGATIDSSLLAYTPPAQAPAIVEPVGTTTAATTTAATTTNTITP